ncbi:hypothetical protein RND81_11G000900 [Saponaria officinalis]|uniref:Uncharacterized protein n=1 Tax=Saponaria officinalis TaxID=3572 RepID=A0AAW1HGF2_SAPOF
MTTMVPSGHPRLLCSTSDTRPDADADQEHVSTSSTSSSTANQQQAASNTSWLQLGLPYPDPPQQQDALMLDLNLGSSSNNNNNPRPHYYYVIRGTGGSPTSSYNPLPIIPPSFSNNPFISDQHPHMWSTGLGSSTHPPIPTNNPFISPPSPFFSDFKLIQPRPRPPPPPIWFMLQPSLHQCTQPFLPPLSKCFLRIKDGRMTVGLVMKYLATKLGLHTESQVLSFSFPFTCIPPFYMHLTLIFSFIFLISSSTLICSYLYLILRIDYHTNLRFQVLYVLWGEKHRTSYYSCTYISFQLLYSTDHSIINTE